MGVRPVVVLDVFALAIGEPDIPPTVLAPVIHSGPPKLCTRQACHRRSSDKRNVQSMAELLSWQTFHLIFC